MSPAFAIRPAAPTDAAAIAQVHTTSWRETYAGLMPAEYLERMTGEVIQRRREYNWRETIAAGQLLTGEDTVVLVAEQDGELVAFASGGTPRDHPGFDAELMTLYCLKQAQGQGIGKALLKTLAQAWHTDGARNLALWVLDVNPTRAWYARLGGREDGEKTVPLPGGGELREVRLVWDDLTRLR